MLTIEARCALLDIEGTVADIRFVYDVMFPFVRQELSNFLNEHWGTPNVIDSLRLLAQDAGSQTWEDWRSGVSEKLPHSRNQDVEFVVSHVNHLMDCDSKSTGLKHLQGLVWESGFKSGALRAEVFEDVVPALKRWRQDGIDVKIYSSGSILAQKLFFGHTTQGDLCSFFSAHYDTTIGSKREAESYQKLAADCQLSPSQIVFLTDVEAELKAASEAGLQVIACCRPNNVPLPGNHLGPRSIVLMNEIVRLPVEPDC